MTEGCIRRFCDPCARLGVARDYPPGARRAKSWLGAGSFQPGTAMFDPSAEPTLIALRDALARVEGTYLIEGHVAADGITDAASLQHLSAQRATAVKEWLAMSGIDPSRLLALGRGVGDDDRIEVAAVR